MRIITWQVPDEIPALLRDVVQVGLRPKNVANGPEAYAKQALVQLGAANPADAVVVMQNVGHDAHLPIGIKARRFVETVLHLYVTETGEKPRGVVFDAEGANYDGREEDVETFLLKPAARSIGDPYCLTQWRYTGERYPMGLPLYASFAAERRDLRRLFFPGTLPAFPFVPMVIDDAGQTSERLAARLAVCWAAGCQNVLLWGDNDPTQAEWFSTWDAILEVLT